MEFFYLSQVLGRPVRTQRGDRVARIKDLVARLEAFDAGGEVSLEEYPPISGLVVDIEKRSIFIPWAQIAELGPQGARLASARIDLRTFERREGEVLLARDILDKQLIDIDGRRVVRANDLQLYQSDGVVRVTAVDVGADALLRRLTLGRLFARIDISPPPPKPETRTLRRRGHSTPAKLIKWADIEPLKAGVPDVRLRLPHERLALLHPVDIARIADELSYKHGAEIIESLDDETAAEALQEMDEERQADIVEEMDVERAADILEEMDDNDAADLLSDLDQIQAEDLLRRMDREDAVDVEELLAYPEDSAGGMMTRDFLVVPKHLSVDEVIALIRSLGDGKVPDLIDYLYVVEDEQPGDDLSGRHYRGGRLLGIVSLRDFLLSPADRCLTDLMNTDFVWVNPFDAQDKVARMIAEYNLLAVPVLDDEERVLGIVTVDDAMDLLVPDERWLSRIPRVFS